MRYLCTRFRKGAPRRGRKEGKGRAGKEGEGRGRAGEGTGNQPVFQQFRKKFEKTCGKIWRGTEKTFIFASAFARKKSVNDER